MKTITINLNFISGKEVPSHNRKVLNNEDFETFDLSYFDPSSIEIGYDVMIKIDDGRTLSITEFKSLSETKFSNTGKKLRDEIFNCLDKKYSDFGNCEINKQYKSEYSDTLPNLLLCLDNNKVTINLVKQNTIISNYHKLTRLTDIHEINEILVITKSIFSNTASYINNPNLSIYIETNLLGYTLDLYGHKVIFSNNYRRQSQIEYEYHNSNAMYNVTNPQGYIRKHIMGGNSYPSNNVGVMRQNINNYHNVAGISNNSYMQDNCVGTISNRVNSVPKVNDSDSTGLEVDNKDSKVIEDNVDNVEEVINVKSEIPEKEEIRNNELKRLRDYGYGRTIEYAKVFLYLKYENKDIEIYRSAKSDYEYGKIRSYVVDLENITDSNKVNLLNLLATTFTDIAILDNLLFTKRIVEILTEKLSLPEGFFIKTTRELLDKRLKTIFHTNEGE